MIDREKVIKGLECCFGSIGKACPMECPYRVECLMQDDEYNMYSVMHDALKLLKEQEPVKPIVNVDEWVCGSCGTWLERQRMIHPSAILHDLCEYCPQCGKKVDWEAVKQDD